MQSAIKARFEAVVGANNVIDDPSLFGPYSDDFTDHYVCKPLAVIRPGSTQEVSEIVKICAELDLPIVTQGGNTSLTGGAITSEADKQIILSMTRMKKVTHSDPSSDTMTVEAGMTLAEVHEAAENIGRFSRFPLPLKATPPSAAARPATRAASRCSDTAQHEI